MPTPTNAALQTYKKYYIDRDYEQVDLFRLLKTDYGVISAVYPGSLTRRSTNPVRPAGHQTS